MRIDFPRFLRPLIGDVLWNKESLSKVIYLTFDDGPVPEVTPQVLEILNRYNWKATFFCVGENVKKNPILYNQIIEQGHKTGNHTFNHLKAFKTKTEEYLNNIEEAGKYIDSTLFRPPHGQINNKIIRKLIQKNYQIVMWDLLTYDYDKKLKPFSIINEIKKNERNGSIVVFHDSMKARENVLEVLPKAIEFWLSKGYKPGLL